MLVHIGGPKSASTTLQRAIFANLAHAYHFGEYGDGNTSEEEDAVFRKIFDFDDQYYSDDQTRQVIEKHVRRAAGREIIFSSADVLAFNRPTLAAIRLRALFGDGVQILMIIRSQFDALVSYYVGHGAWLKPAPRPYFRAFVPFAEWLEYQKLGLSDSKLRTFSYWDQITPFCRIFGETNVHIIPLEDLTGNLEPAWKTLSHLTGAGEPDIRARFQSRKERERPSIRQVAIGRLASFLVPVVHAPDIRNIKGAIGNLLSGGASFSVALNENQRVFIGDYYRDGNLNIGNTFGLNLARHYYPGFSR
jgi:hypothetical protein